MMDALININNNTNNNNNDDNDNNNNDNIKWFLIILGISALNAFI